MASFRKFGLIGKKLGHSFSARYFNEKFFKEGIPASYELFELVEAGEFPALLESEAALAGLNVTIPYKEAVIPFLDSLSPEAEAVGAVNTIRIETASLRGYNTDIYGFSWSLEHLLKGAAISRALIIGTGGAAKAAAYVLRNEYELDLLELISRNPQKEGQISYAEAAKRDLGEYQLIVNATPVGMYPNIEAAPDLNYAALGKDNFVMDMIYNPHQTLFLKLAEEQGAKIMNGLEMLIAQAEKAWAIWNDSSEDNPRE